MADMLEKYYDNSLGNIGNHDSFVWYGPQWASAATAPARGAKSYTTEGGIHCPCIVRYPPALQKGVINNSFTTVMDIMPTLLELAGVSHPGKTFRGREVESIRGKSWVPLLKQPEGDTVQVYDPKVDIVGWEQLGMAAVRVGDWKALFIPPPRGPGRWELYNIFNDPSEICDLAESHPKKLGEMINHYETYYQETGMFDAYTMFQTAMRQRKEVRMQERLRIPLPASQSNL